MLGLAVTLQEDLNSFQPVLEGEIVGVGRPDVLRNQIRFLDDCCHNREVRLPNKIRQVVHERLAAGSIHQKPEVTPRFADVTLMEACESNPDDAD